MPVYGNEWHFLFSLDAPPWGLLRTLSAYASRAELSQRAAVLALLLIVCGLGWAT